MLLVSAVLMIVGWMLVYGGIRNVSIKTQVLGAFGAAKTREPVK